MNIKANKILRINAGTDVILCTPSHPLTYAMQMKRILDRIAQSSDKEFEYNCNSIDAIELCEKYGRDILGISVKYRLNGKPASYGDITSDLRKAQEFVSQIIREEYEQSTRHI